MYNVSTEKKIAVREGRTVRVREFWMQFQFSLNAHQGREECKKRKGTYGALVYIHAPLATNIKQFICQLTNLEHRLHNICHFYATAAKDVLVSQAVGRRGLMCDCVGAV